MKKVLLLIILFFCFTIDAYSLNTSESFIAEDWIPNIYINKVKSGIIHYRQARFITNKSNTKIAYCVQPFEEMKTDKYNGYDVNQASKLGISNEVWERISLIAYYGYGYMNHTSNKWYAVTQVMIWREVDKDAKFYFTDKLNGTKINSYDDEINEIEKLIKKHYLLPSFANNTYNYSIYNFYELIDNNDVLKQFTITKNTSDIILNKEKNKLYVETNSELETNITFERKFENYNTESIVFIDNKYQDLMVPGNVKSIEFNIGINVIGGRIKINKLDYDTNLKSPSGDGFLIGTKYNIYNSTGEIVETLEINNDYEAISKLLPFGKYLIKELESMDGYMLDENEYEVTIDSKQTYMELNLKNKPIKSTIEIYKYYDDKLEAGISFEIYNSKGEIVDVVTTNKDGKIIKELYYGKYLFHQLNSTKNYKCVDDFEVIINENSDSIIRLNLYDEKFSSKLLIVKKDSISGEIIKDETVFKIYDILENKYVKNKDLDTFTTIAGYIVIDNLEAGEYYLEEYIAPNGYIKKQDRIYFIIDESNIFEYDEDGKPIYKIQVSNDRKIINIEVPDTSQNIEYEFIPFIEDKKKLIMLFS